MVVLKCKMCSGNIIPLEEGSLGVCDSCGTQVVLPSLSDEKRADAFNRGNQFRKDFEFDKALEEYSRIIREDPTDGEAHWCMALCRYGIYYQKDYGGAYVPTFARISETSFLEDPDYKAAIQYAAPEAKAVYRKEAEYIEKTRQELIRVAARTEPYDVFISFKDTYTEDPNRRTQDSYAAQEIYLYLTNQGYRVFFSRITLKEEHAGEEYEPYIYAALNTARVMLVVGTCKEHYEAPWVKNEWSRFRAIRQKDPTKVLLACYQDMNVRDIPLELQALEALNIKDPDGGFYTHINYIVSRECRKQQKQVSHGNQITAENYVTRAFQAIEDQDFKTADQHLEKALDLDPENGKAHMGKLLVSTKCRGAGELVEREQSLGKNGHYQRALKYGDANQQQQLRAAEAEIRQRLDKRSKDQKLSQAADRFVKADTSEELAPIVQELQEFGDYGKAPQYARDAQAKLEKILQAEAEEAEARRIQEEKEAEERRIQQEKEEKERREREAREAKEKAEKEAAERAAAKKAARAIRRKKRGKHIRRLVVLAIIVGVAGYFFNKNYYAPAKEAYSQAEAAMESGDYQNATLRYYEAARMPGASAFFGDAADKGYEACTQWLGYEPVVATSGEESWYSVDGDGLLSFDLNKYYESGNDSFILPTLLDGKLITGLGNSCFSGFDGLNWVAIPDNYITVGDYCFSNCTNLSSVAFGKNTAYIGYEAFSDCDSLTAVEFPEGIRTIGDSAFYGCDYLMSVSFNQGLERIGGEAFYSCPGITAITIPGTVTEIGYEAFYGANLASLTLEDGVGYIGESAFSQCEYLTSVTIPGSATVGNYAFYSCDTLGEVILESGVETLGEYAFADCDQLWNLGISDTLTRIGAYAFNWDSAISSITLPGSLTEIGEYAFYECSGIGTLTIQDNGGLTIGDYAFRDCDGMTSVYLGSGTITLNEGTFNDCDALTEVSLPEGLESIGPWCFASTAVKTFEVPDSVTYVGEGAFSYNDSLTGVTFSSGVTTVESRTFENCGSLYWVGFYDTLSIIQDDAFYGCDSLTQIYYTGGEDQWYAVSKGNNSWIDQCQLIANYSA